MMQIPQNPHNSFSIIGPSVVGNETILGWGVIIGHPDKNSVVSHRSFLSSSGAIIGERCVLRSGTVIYENVVIGNDVHTAHHVVIREGVRIGDGCVFGNNTEVLIGAQLGKNVRLSTNVIISENARLGNDIFIGPGVTFTGGRYMTGALQASGRMSQEEAFAVEGKYWEGPSAIIEDDVRIGANSTLLAGVKIEKGSIIAAGSVISTNIPAYSFVAGNPARIMSKMINKKETGA